MRPTAWTGKASIALFRHMKVQIAAASSRTLAVRTFYSPRRAQNVKIIAG
jgi:hypothetical protein